jgi:hypothetical protein
VVDTVDVRPTSGSTAFISAIVFAGVLSSRLLLALAMAPFIADLVWTLLMALGALGYAIITALSVALVDASSRRLGPTLKFGVRVFGGMFLVGAYLVSQLIDVLFAFLPHVLVFTGPFLLGAAVVGIVSGLLVAGVVQMTDALLRRMRIVGV